MNEQAITLCGDSKRRTRKASIGQTKGQCARLTTVIEGMLDTLIRKLAPNAEKRQAAMQPCCCTRTSQTCFPGYGPLTCDVDRHVTLGNLIHHHPACVHGTVVSVADRRHDDAPFGNANFEPVTAFDWLLNVGVGVAVEPLHLDRIQLANERRVACQFRCVVLRQWRHAVALRRACAHRRNARRLFIVLSTDSKMGHVHAGRGRFGSGGGESSQRLHVRLPLKLCLMIGNK